MMDKQNLKKITIRRRNELNNRLRKIVIYINNNEKTKIYKKEKAP